jgi:hypothetical protein
MTMIARSYIEFCESLWSDWLSDTVDVPAPFLRDFAPEPYLWFGEATAAKPLYVLFTNPGAGLQRQHRQEILDGKSCVSPTMSYHEASLAFAASYRNGGISHSATTRNEALEHLRDLCGADCIVQFESLPFHSPELQRKHLIPDLVKSTDRLSAYVAQLADAMKSISVVGLSSVGSSQSISVSTVADSPWLSWQAKSLLGIDPKTLRLTTLAEKGDKITSAFLYQRVGDCTRGIVLTMGGNNFPRRDRLNEVAQTLLS